MYMDDIKLSAKNKKELETLIHAMCIYCQDIGMEFWHRKMRHARNENRQTIADGRNETAKSRQN